MENNEHSQFEKISQRRKLLQKEGQVPDWYTNSWHLHFPNPRITLHDHRYPSTARKNMLQDLVYRKIKNLIPGL